MGVHVDGLFHSLGKSRSRGIRCNGTWSLLLVWCRTRRRYAEARLLVGFLGCSFDGKKLNWHWNTVLVSTGDLNILKKFPVRTGESEDFDWEQLMHRLFEGRCRRRL